MLTAALTAGFAGAEHRNTRRAAGQPITFAAAEAAWDAVWVGICARLVLPNDQDGELYAACEASFMKTAMAL